jgi:ATP-dependent DNA helicase RecG
MAIGTHALIEHSFSLENLGLVIIDEQHKFGVSQREKLVRKGEYPHLLVMTATPIPRTLGLTLYGDLDVSVIDELPSGRRPVQTFVRTRESRPRVLAFVRKQLAEGRQAYVVCPRVEESGASELKAVTKEWETLQKELAPCRAALLHGRMPPEEKETVMAGFRTGKTQVLLSTSLIEVGVDVPNATLMIIEDADHFGLAQLHQLRGRIGRGTHDSFCILLTSGKSPEPAERLRIMVETTDGFKIAEEDLKLRGPGDLLGQSQSGLATLVFGKLAEDLRWIEAARLLARRILEEGSSRAG